jgi:hypothetical protein
MAQSRIKALLATGSLVAAAFFGVSQPAYPVHDTTVFELDGNVADPGGGGDDWATVNIVEPKPAQVLARTKVLADPAPQSIFAGGGSKDDLDLNGPLSGAGGWKHKSGSVPDKDDITNAYAAAYNVGGKLVIYAGADRIDNSGDAFMGFWFFQNQIGLGSGGGGGGAPFVGQHAIGDVLVLANFTGGGTTVNIEVLEWVGTGGNVNGTLRRIAGVAGGTPATCSGGLAGDLFCGITNTTGGETPPWPYLSKSGSASFPAATFFEVGINISDVFAQAGAGAVPCFSSFMAETRSSSSVSAVLKDFALGSFPVCGVKVSKQCKSPTLAGNDMVRYTIEGKVDNTGFGTLSNVSLSDNPTEEAAFQRFACDASGLPTGSALGGFGTGVSIAPLQSACYRTTFLTATNGQDDVVTVTANAGSATVTASQGADCQNLNLSPSIDVSKTCTTMLAQENNKLVVKVNIEGSVCNISTDGTPLSNVSLTDTDVGALTLLDNSPSGPASANANLAAAQCKFFKSSYFPATAENRIALNSSTLVPGLARFTDIVTATATAPLQAQVTPDTAEAACTLCPTCVPDVCTVAGGCPGNK